MIRHTELHPSDLSDLPPEVRARLQARQAAYEARVAAGSVAAGASLPMSPRLPSWRTMAADLTQTLGATAVRLAKGQPITRTAEHQAACLAICHQCPRWMKTEEGQPGSGRCAKCGCVGAFAAYLAAKPCPLGKWPT